MAKRSKTHILEDKSRIKFNEILPEYWVCRDKDKDYGIDCEVEIFDDNGNSTGLVFWVQLKATESKKQYDIKNIHFDVDKIEQFISYALPVMIVRYSTNDDILYYNWANDITCRVLNEDRTKIKIKFNEEKTLNNTNFESICDYILRFHRVKNGNIKFPIDTYITKKIGFSDKVETKHLQFFKKIILDKPQYFNLVRNEDDSQLQIIVGNEKTYLSLSDTSFSSIGYDLENLQGNERYFTNVFLCCYCIILYDSSKNDEADKIFFENMLIAFLKLKKDFLIPFLPYLLLGEKYEFILECLDNDIFDITEDNTIQFISLINLFYIDKFNKDRKDAIEKFLKKQIDYAKAKDYIMGVAIAYYNLGTFYRGSQKFIESAKCYLEARKYHRDYTNRGYYYYEFAEVLFKLKRYWFSSIFYQKAIELNVENDNAKALLADSLIYQGRYEEAVKLLDEFLIEQGDNLEIDKNEWQLKYMCIYSLIELNGFPKSQKRDLDKAIIELNLGNISEALDYDMLYAKAWFEKAKKAEENNHISEIFISCLMAALFNKENISYWIYATISGFRGMNLKLEESVYKLSIEYIIKTAYFYHKEYYIDSLCEYLEENIPTILEPVMDFVNICLKHLPKDDLATFRIFE